MKVIPVDVFSKEGDLMRIEFYDLDGAHIIDAQWDDTDEQTNENRIKFREWACRFIEQKGYEVTT